MAEATPEAQEKYMALVSGMDVVQEGLDELTRLIKRSYVGIDSNWRSKSRRELQALREKAQDALDDFRDIAKRYETDMVAKEWRA
ncbi:hypothetical protein L6E12_26115 [Actinokineospora sp. PR83]|uniref:hypothetical protein n=1 Tax=Actinokineospora sp. PR83 TaxID=2884908 RepID=UPI001F306363|nr:hypothetical protein [Actinokineospora sp. PR83]MCG8919255.1 hypothetical protein [Actinokineospora sp. PR83]